MPSDANVMPAASSSRPADPRALLVAVCLVVVASVATVRTLPAMLALFVFAAVWHAVAGNRPGVTLKVIRRILPFAAVIIVLNAVLVPGTSLLAVAGHRVASVEGAHDGFFFALRLGVMLMSVSLLLTATDPESLARGVHDLVRHVSAPLAGRIAFFTFLSMGFVPLFVDEIQRVRVAQSFRGGDLKGGMLRRAGSVRMWLVPVLMSAVRRSGQMALAVELREIRPRLIPALPAPRMRAADILGLMLVAAVVVAASLAR
jgi:energy-coupling factor transport system permease protein